MLFNYIAAGLLLYSYRGPSISLFFMPVQSIPGLSSVPKQPRCIPVSCCTIVIQERPQRDDDKY